MPTAEPRRETARKEIKRAYSAHTDLNIFAAVVTLLEGGHIYDAESQPAALKIIRICQAEQQRCLRTHDRAMAKALALLTQQDRADAVA